MSDSANDTAKGWRGVWRDLTGRSHRWGLTIVYGVIFARLSIIPLLVLFALTTDVMNNDPLEGFSGAIGDIDAVRILSALVFAPLIESALVAFIVWLVSVRLRWPGWIAVSAVVVLSVPLHGLVLGSLLVAPFFALMATIQLNWTRRGDGLGGYFVVVTLHALVNAIALLTTWTFR
ncbi:MAG: hypothetical protein IM674_02465 [Brevundimonas sp.]|nr:hypothetical protein [Brevundimonas sp.]MCA3717097.1 hypothetical protein [Brevundimonas sp.]